MAGSKFSESSGLAKPRPAEQIAGRMNGSIETQSGAGGLSKMRVRHEQAEAEIYLHGGHVTSYRPAGAEELLWMSDQAVFAPPKAIRGGVPVCWPWFGPKDGLPQHGLARNRGWQLRGQGDASVTLGLRDDEETRAIWPHAFELELTVTVGAQLRMDLRSRNTGDAAIEVGGALHTYFRIGSIEQIAIHGLEGCEYLDSLAGGERQRQEGPVTFAGEVDRIYLDRGEFTEIEDPVWQRRIRVRKEGSATTVVWNPWIEKAVGMSDFPNDGYRGMVCVETANAAEDVRVLPPGGEHVLTQVVEIV